MKKVLREYKAHKFGGSSMANAERFKAIKPLLSGQNEVIVVSAVQGVTSAIQHMIDTATKRETVTLQLETLETTHHVIAKALLAANESNDVIAAISHDLAEIKDILHSVQLTGSCSKETQEFLLGYGETWSAKLLAAYLGQTAKVCYLDASTVLFAYEKNGMKGIDWQKSQAALDAYLADHSFDQIVITGFIASTLEGKRITLGRNGSDFSAAIFAKLFKTKELTIWTDVDGIYTADPNRVRSAFVVSSISYKEALELAYFGAKVLHPMTIGPALEANIPILIKNSYNPKATGTLITAHPEKSPYIIKGITSVDSIALINIEGTGMIGVSSVAARVFQALNQVNISVILISQASSEYSICLAVATHDAERAKAALFEHLQFEIERKHIEAINIDQSCGILSVIGDDMIGSVGVSGKLCDSLAKANINIRAISQGSSERNISIVISNTDINKALQTVHASFYLSRKTLSIGLIGPGVVGSALLKQIDSALAHLKSHYQLNLYVRGIMNSHHMLLQHKAIDLTKWNEALAASTTKADLTLFAEHILADDIPHALIIDCTANQAIAQHYLLFLERGIHVITPNKHANAGKMTYYHDLKAISQRGTQHYLYEATVCAGLPVINTLQDLLKTGDKVTKIEGVVSGTLSYIFNEMAHGKVFSDIVIEAKKLGYTEPDPREDLAGSDVARKLVCLAREVGFDVNLEDVKVHDLVPDALRECSVDEFLKKLPAFDKDIMPLAAKATANGERLCYVGTIDSKGKITVAINGYGSNHPFARLGGTDNMIIFHTERYDTNPLVIQGPGAGAEVTAAGVFADVLRLASYLS